MLNIPKKRSHTSGFATTTALALRGLCCVVSATKLRPTLGKLNVMTYLNFQVTTHIQLDVFSTFTRQINAVIFFCN